MVKVITKLQKCGQSLILVKTNIECKNQDAIRIQIGLLSKVFYPISIYLIDII